MALRSTAARRVSRGLAGATVLALVVTGPHLACSDVETAAPPIDVPARADDQPAPPERDPAAPPRRSLARRIAPLLEPPPPPPLPEEVAPGIESVGVPECDDYLRNYMRCIEESMPEGTRTTMRDTMKQVAKAWRDVAGNPGSTAALAEGCRTAGDAARSAFSSMGCTWE
jgi:hypothetical protein